MSYQVNIDEESILFENEWLTRQALADLIKRKIDSQDFSISAAGGALEFLQHAVANARQIQFKLAPADAERLERYARKAELTTGAFVRQALLAYLAAQPALEDEAPAKVDAAAATVTTITTEPAAPEEAGAAVELTARKSEDTPEAPPATPSPEPPQTQDVGDAWFKKS